MDEQGKRFDIDAEEYRRQFESRREVTTPGIITFMLSRGIVRTTLQAQFVLSGSIAVMLLVISYQWFGSVLNATPRPTQAQIDEALPTPSAPATQS